MYKYAKVIIFVYDIRSQKSFDDLNNFWYDEIKNNSTGNPVYAVVHNKNDLYQNQQVDINDAKDFAKKLGGIFSINFSKKWWKYWKKNIKAEFSIWWRRKVGKRKL